MIFKKKTKHTNLKILFFFCSLLLSFAQSLERMALSSLLPSVCTQEATNNKNISIKILESNTLFQGVPHCNTSGMLKILLWAHTSLPQTEGVQLLIQGNDWFPALVAYLSVLIAFLMSFKWGNIKPCNVNLPQVGCWIEVSQKALLWCWNWCTTPHWNLFLRVWFVNHRAGPAPPCVLLTQRKTLSASLLRSELALATGEQDSSLRFGNMQLQKFSLRSKGMAASKAQFGHSYRLIAIHSGRAIPWTLRNESISQLSWGDDSDSSCCSSLATLNLLHPGLGGLEELRFFLQWCCALLDVYNMLGLL